MQAKKLILFDIDKTLVSEMVRGSDPWRSSFHEVYGVNSPINVTGADTHGMTHKQIIIESMRNNGLSDDEIMAKMSRFMSVFENHYQQSLDNGKIDLYPKIPELLDRLKEKGHLLGLVTGNTQKIAFMKLDKAGIGAYFKCGGFGDDSPDREKLVEKALERARDYSGSDISPHDIFLVGDTPKDISAAEKFGINTIAVATGIYTQKELKETGADYVLETLENVEHLLSIIESDVKREGKPQIEIGQRSTLV
ncbi:MAG: Haloacid dehalogenase [Berkelbacteria bacterium GW2011_GWA2_35_9]|uniref:Haloacid dehalogenase n=1 Tax=Berkelbacteria bacterium GW2011_GWA2_35_9 TaxID=1618333 RepID=A0A0G0DIC0_9BACT|nr:MAG: Haloacid dehalogenase [Berkelbacteria bacterium GW2011_GWA2_35_9]